MLPVVTWLSFAITAYVLWTVVFRARYGFSPVAERFPPRDFYGWMDFGLAACLIGYSAWIVFGARGEPMLDGAGTWIGLGLVVLGAGLRLWAVLTLGRNWRIGQADNDERAEFVASGPYRVMHHPINVALVLVAMGQTFMTGLNLRSMALLGFATVYLLVQARAEERHWAGKRADLEACATETETGMAVPASTLSGSRELGPRTGGAAPCQASSQQPPATDDQGFALRKEQERRRNISG